MIRGSTSDELVISFNGFREINTVDPVQTLRTTHRAAMIWIDLWCDANTALNVAAVCFGLDASWLHLRVG